MKAKIIIEIDYSVEYSSDKKTIDKEKYESLFYEFFKMLIENESESISSDDLVTFDQKLNIIDDMESQGMESQGDDEWLIKFDAWKIDVTCNPSVIVDTKKIVEAYSTNKSVTGVQIVSYIPFKFNIYTGTECYDGEVMDSLLDIEYELRKTIMFETSYLAIGNQKIKKNLLNRENS